MPMRLQPRGSDYLLCGWSIRWLHFILINIQFPRGGPTWEHVSCHSAFYNPLCPHVTLAQRLAEVNATTS